MIQTCSQCNELTIESLVQVFGWKNWREQRSVKMIMMMILMIMMMMMMISMTMTKIAMKNMMTMSKIEDDDQTGPDLRWTLALALFLHRSLPIAAIVVNKIYFWIRIMIILPPQNSLNRWLWWEWRWWDLVQSKWMVFCIWENVPVQLPTIKDLIVLISLVGWCWCCWWQKELPWQDRLCTQHQLRAEWSQLIGLACNVYYGHHTCM